MFFEILYQRLNQIFKEKKMSAYYLTKYLLVDYFAEKKHD